MVKPVFSAPRLAQAAPALQSEKLMWEKELLGLFVSAHPLSDYQQTLRLENVTAIKNVKPSAVNQVRIGGVITKVQKIMTKTGRPMMFSWIEDLTSKIELVIFPNVYEKYPDVLKENLIVIATGKINDRDGNLKLLCDSIKTVAALS